MSIYSFKINFPGQNNGVIPRFGHLYSQTDNLATISTAGYLNPYVASQNFTILPTDIIFVAATDGNQIYYPVINAGTGVITLTHLP